MYKAAVWQTCLILALVGASVSAAPFYVDCQLTTALNNGSSWSNACQILRDDVA